MKECLDVRIESNNSGKHKVYDFFGNRLGTIEQGWFYPGKIIMSGLELQKIAKFCRKLKND